MALGPWAYGPGGYLKIMAQYKIRNYSYSGIQSINYVISFSPKEKSNLARGNALGTR